MSAMTHQIDRLGAGRRVDDSQAFAAGRPARARVVHCFQLRDGLITREIAYELWRELDSEMAHDDIPEDAVWEIFSETPETN